MTPQVLIEPASGADGLEDSAGNGLESVAAAVRKPSTARRMAWSG